MTYRGPQRPRQRTRAQSTSRGVLAPVVFTVPSFLERGPNTIRPLKARCLRLYRGRCGPTPACARGSLRFWASGRATVQFSTGALADAIRQSGPVGYWLTIFARVRRRCLKRLTRWSWLVGRGVAGLLRLRRGRLSGVRRRGRFDAALLSLAIAFGLVLAACWSHLLWKVIERARRSAAAV
jgi:hypothetical protein